MNGNRCQENLIPMLVQKYGVEVGGEDGKEDFDQVKPFHRFVLFAHDSIKFRKPMEPDIHWSAMSSTFVVNGGQYDKFSGPNNLTKACKSFWIQSKQNIYKSNEIPPFQRVRRPRTKAGPYS